MLFVLAKCLALLAVPHALAQGSSNAGCPPVTGYTPHTSGNFCGPEFQFMGNFTNVSLQGLIENCTQWCDCTGVNYYSQDQSGTLQDMTAGAGAACVTPGCFYTRDNANSDATCTACAKIPNYTAHINLDHWHSDINPTDPLPFSALVVAEMCTQRPDCKGFNSRGFLKSASDNLTEAAGSCFYTRTDTSGPPIITTPSPSANSSPGGRTDTPAPPIISTPSTSANNSGGGPGAGTIAGIAVGSVFGGAAVLAVIWYFLRQQIKALFQWIWGRLCGGGDPPTCHITINCDRCCGEVNICSRINKAYQRMASKKTPAPVHVVADGTGEASTPNGANAGAAVP